MVENVNPIFLPHWALAAISAIPSALNSAPLNTFSLNLQHFSLRGSQKLCPQRCCERNPRLQSRWERISLFVFWLDLLSEMALSSTFYERATIIGFDSHSFCIISQNGSIVKKYNPAFLNETESWSDLFPKSEVFLHTRSRKMGVHTRNVEKSVVFLRMQGTKPELSWLWS